ncbi:MAG: TrkA family potassium uptake protein [Bacillota bacterium]
MPNDKEFVVIGLGRFGSNLARTLHRMGYNVLGIDLDEAKVQKNVDNCTHVVEADATDEHTLRSLGAGNFEVGIVSIGNNLEASVLVTLLLKEIGVSDVISKASSDVHGKLLRRVGADRVVFPERDMGIRLANHLAVDNIVDYLEITPDVSIVEINTTSAMQGKTLRELDVRARFGVNVLAIRRAGQKVVVSPGPDDPIDEGDILIALGTNDAVRKWQKAQNSEK